MRRGGDSWAVRAVAGFWICAIVGGFVAGALGVGRYLLDDSPGCLFKWATGVDCPFCGMTHATVALGAGDWSAAHHAHPLALVVIGGSLAIFGLAIVGRSDVFLRGRRPLAILIAVAAIWALRLVL